ncbi:15202_t:CDS:2, partial [Gigaspora rosea]
CKLPDAKPGVRVLPLLRSPQMMYYKQADVQETEEEKKYDQETHVCLMGQGRDTRQIQLDFLAERSNQLSLDIKQQAKLLSEIEDKISKSPNSQVLQDTVNSQGHFGHRFVIHNAKAIWNNSLRNLIYRLWDLIEQHQGLTYYMSTSAVRFIRDMQKNIRQQMEREIYKQSLSDDTILTNIDSYEFDTNLAAEMLRKLVGEKDANFIVQNETALHHENYTETTETAHDDIPEGYSLLMERAQIKVFSIVEDWSKGDIINEVVITRTVF